MTGWPEVKVADLIRDRLLMVGDGYRVRNAELGSTGVPFVRGGDIGANGEVNTDVADRIVAATSPQVVAKMSDPGDVLFITKGTVGRVGFLRQNQPRIVVAPQVAVWRSLDHSKLVPRFVYYLLRSHSFQAQLDGVKTHGSMAADYVSISDQMSFRLPLPSVRHQHHVAQFLGVLDDKIDLNRRMNQTLEAQAQALFKAWFVNFDAARADAGGFPTDLSESEVGPIPSNWRVATLGELGRNSRIQVEPANVDPLTPYIGLEHMPRGSICLGEWGEAASVQSAKLRFERGQILFGKLRPYFKKVGVALTDGICSSDILVLEPIFSKQFGFVLGHLTRQELIDYAANVSGGTRMPRVSWDDLAKFRVAVPPSDAIHVAFEKVMRPVVARLESSVTESKTLREIRDFLLPKLLSGELRVRDAERKVAAIA